MNSSFFVIWGMHRSGTSLLGAAMRVFGAGPESALMHADESNPKGYYEDPALVQLNDDMLAELGLKWQSLTPIGEAHTILLEKAGYLDKAVAFLQKRAKAAPLSMLKDPRMARLGAIWRKAFAEMGQEPYSVVIWRNPGAVAASLRQRALKSKVHAPEQDLRQGLLLWLLYTQGSLLYTSGYPRALVNYDKFLHNPDRELRRVSSELPFPLSETDLEKFCAEFVAPEMNHHGISQEQLPAAVAELASALSRADTCPEPGILWPHTDEERSLAGLLDDANRALREHSAKMASIHSEICLLTGQLKRMILQQAEKKA